MAFKTFYFSLWLFFILFTIVQGSCLEYGHSCWGAHGKRSGNNKMYHAEEKAPIEFDFQDLNGLSEKNTYDSTEEQLNGSTDMLPPPNDLVKDLDDELLIEKPDKNSLKVKRFFYKNLNKTGKKQHNRRITEHHMKKATSMPLISERWQRLPLYNLRRMQITRPENEWLDELQQQQANEDEYI